MWAPTRHRAAVSPLQRWLLPPMQTSAYSWQSWWTVSATVFFMYVQDVQSQHTGKTKCENQTSWCGCTGPVFQVEIRADITSLIIDSVQYVAIMCVIKQCSWLCAVWLNALIFSVFLCTLQFEALVPFWAFNNHAWCSQPSSSWLFKSETVCIENMCPSLWKLQEDNHCILLVERGAGRLRCTWKCLECISHKQTATN
jgi:hypothetical protein